MLPESAVTQFRMGFYICNSVIIGAFRARIVRGKAKFAALQSDPLGAAPHASGCLSVGMKKQQREHFDLLILREMPGSAPSAPIVPRAYSEISFTYV